MRLAGGVVASVGYANFCKIVAQRVVDVCFPGDPGAALPQAARLKVMTASPSPDRRCISTMAASDHATDQLTRAVLAAGTPIFGSCWGLQILTVAAGGSVRRNPKGRELGFGRSIKLTEAGRKHPMYAGKPDVFNAPTVHLDEVETVAPGMTVLATNAVSNVQSAEIHYNGGTAWGVQYHPEYPLREISAIVRRIGPRLIGEGFFLNEADIETFASDLVTLDRTRMTSARLAARYQSKRA
jgi:GMP synthase (glutamine-hydrolysing)